MVEVDIRTEDGYLGRGSSPTGSSVGRYEAAVVRDGNPAEYNGQSVHSAVDNVKNIIGPAIVGLDVDNQEEIDRRMIELDATPNKGRLGGNAIYSASIAVIRAAAAARRIPVYQLLAGGAVKTVPIPSFNIVNGGRYGEITLAFNEFLVVPYRAETIAEAVEIGVKCLTALGKVLRRFLKAEPAVGRSYGWAAPSDDPDAVLGLMREMLDEIGGAGKVAFALDCAMSEMHDAGTGRYRLKGKDVPGDELIDYLKELTEKHPLVFVEDPLDENDWDGYAKAAGRLPRTLVVGDDLTVTNMERIKRANELGAIQGFVLKPNQVGTITEALEAHRYASERGLISIPSGRAGGVIDDIVMDFSVGLGASIQKNGAPRSGERIDKLNFLMRARDTNPGCELSRIDHLIKF
jgi:enolase